MFLNRKDIECMGSILTKFPDVESFELEQTGNSGIGKITSLTFKQEVNGVFGTFTVEVSGVGDW